MDCRRYHYVAEVSAFNFFNNYFLFAIEIRKLEGAYIIDIRADDKYWN